MRRGSSASLPRLWRASQKHYKESLTVRCGSSMVVSLLPGIDKRVSSGFYDMSTQSYRYRYYSYSPMEWWQNRQLKKQEEKYKSRILQMAEMKEWTLKNMGEELADVTASWAAKIPGINQSMEIKMAKQMETLLGGLISIVGENATEERLEQMDQKEKLKAALAGETTVEEINRLIHQFQITSLMHKIVRKRKEEGRPIPTTAEGMQSAVQVDGPALWSKAHRTRMGKDHARKMLRRRR